MINIESIKAKIRNLAKNNNLSSQEVLQISELSDFSNKSIFFKNQKNISSQPIRRS